MKMEIFTLLGSVIDGFINEGEMKSKDNGNVTIVVTNSDIINECILPLCDDDVSNGYWCLNFGKNPHNGNGELVSVTHIFSGKETTVNVKKRILDRLSIYGLDELYFKMCNEIIL